MPSFQADLGYHQSGSRVFQQPAIEARPPADAQKQEQHEGANKKFYKQIPKFKHLASQDRIE